jgi:hypothetical protein
MRFPPGSARIEDLIDSVEGLLTKGHGALVMELADLLREQLSDAFEAIDDSGHTSNSKMRKPSLNLQGF